ncbi:MAG: hypothetical protein AB7L92_05715, partial [Alphaproteobacteria bacterium]
MSDFNIFSHLNTMGFGRGGPQAGPSDPANEKESAQIVVDAAGEKAASVATKMLGVPNLSQLGQVGINKQFESEGIAGKSILPTSILPDARGGFLVNLFHTIFIKNREITDHTRYINEGGTAADSGSSGGGDGGGGGGGDVFTGGGSSFSDYNTMDMGGIVSPSDFPTYSMSSVAMADLGNFAPPSFGIGQS